MVKIFSLSLLALLISLPVFSATAATAKLNRNSITINESVQLILQSEDDINLPAEALQQLQKYFEVKHRGNNSSTSCANWDCETTVTATYQLTPKNVGLFSIPAMAINGEKTQVLQLRVSAANNNPSSKNVDAVFIETSIDKTQSYVQEQILLTFKINNSIELRDLSLEQEFMVENASAKLIQQTSYERNINNQRYNTAELTYAVFPQKSGILNIPAIQIVAQASRGGFRSSRLRLRSDPQTVMVNASPEHKKNWLPAKHLQLSESFSDDINHIQVGDSITRTITTTAIGLTAEQLPPIKIRDQKTYKAYPDQPKLEDKNNEQGTVGIRTDTIAIVATQPGEITLPAIDIQWWNTQKNSFETARLKAITLTIAANPDAIKAPAVVLAPAPVAQAAPIAIPASPTKNTAMFDHQNVLIWQIISAISLIIAAVFAILYIKKPAAIRVDANNTASIDADNTQQEALKKLLQACQSQQPHQVRQSLLLWAKATWPLRTPHSLMDISQISKNAILAKHLKQLDAKLYTDTQQNYDFMALYQVVEKTQTQSNNTQQQALKVLYPVS